MKKFILSNWKFWLKSSIVTFLSVAVPMFAADISLLDYPSLETAGLSGAFVVVLRLAIKAAWFGTVSLVVYLSTKFAGKK